MLGGIETIRVLNTVGFEVNKVEQSTEERRKIEIKHHIYMALSMRPKHSTKDFSQYWSSSCRSIWSRWALFPKAISWFMPFCLLILRPAAREIHRIPGSGRRELYSGKRSLQYFASTPGHFFTEQDATATINENKNEPIVSVKNLSFAYHGNEDVTILNGISLTIKDGESIGIAGASGCGKTTFIHILLKLIHGYGGEVSLFDKSLQTISREELADLIAYVPQKPFVFSGTVKNNILYGSRKTITDEAISEAAKNAGIFDEIQESLGGFDVIISENGNNLSGGQRQRRALAPRYAANTPIDYF